jgi:hypothetical protein
MVSKAEFVRSLQTEGKALSPFDISQRVRIAVGCVAAYQGDADLAVEHYRGYMVKFSDKPNRSAEDPELYICVISLNQTAAWQSVVWIKEILQILDHEAHRTDTREKLVAMLKVRETASPNGHGTPPHVIADKNGLTLAIASAVPKSYRDVLREQRFLDRYDPDELEKVLLVPSELIARLLSSSFEGELEEALESCAHD